MCVCLCLCLRVFACVHACCVFSDFIFVVDVLSVFVQSKKRSKCLSHRECGSILSTRRRQRQGPSTLSGVSVRAHTCVYMSVRDCALWRAGMQGGRQGVCGHGDEQRALDVPRRAMIMSERVNIDDQSL